MNTKVNLALITLLVFLSTETSLHGVAQAITVQQDNTNKDKPWVEDTNNNNQVYGETNTVGFRKSNKNYRKAEDMLKRAFPYILGLYIPIVILLFYNKALESWVGDRRIRAMCRPSTLHFDGFTTQHVMIDIESDLPVLRSVFRYSIIQTTKDLKKGKLVPNFLLEKSEQRKYPMAFPLSYVGGDATGEIETGDILIAVDCKPIVVPKVGRSMDYLTKLLEERAASKWYELRLPVVLTILKPNADGPLCPPFAYFSELGECCAKVDDLCPGNENKIELTTRSRYLEAVQNKVLAEIWTKEYPRVVKEQGSQGVAIENDPFKKGQEWRVERKGIMSSTFVVFLKHLIIAGITLGVTAYIIYVPLHHEDEFSVLPYWMYAGVTGGGVLTVLTWLGTMIYNKQLAEGSSLSNANMIYVALLAWLTVVLLPGAIFVGYRWRSENSDHRAQVRFNFCLSFVGLSFSLLYLLHTALQVGKARFHLDVPSLLSQHLSELVLGFTGFLDAFGSFKELSRSLYANGGACNLGDLNSELVKIKRNGKSVKWSCEGDNEGTLNVDVADGTTCNVICSAEFVKPVTCYDYGLIGGEWVMIHGNSTERFCCHPFVCNEETHYYNATACGWESDGCIKKPNP